MPGTATPPPAPVAAPAIDLDKAMSGSAASYLAAADAHIAAGGTLPYAHQKHVDAVRGAIGRVHNPDGLRPDAPPPDTRTSAQRQHDATYGLGQPTDPSQYFIPRPAAMPEAHFAEFNGEARALAAGLSLPAERGNALVGTIVAAASELAQADDAAAVTAKWENRLAAVFPGDKLAAARVVVDDLLKSLEHEGAKKLVERLRSRGTLNNPTVFMTLHGRALTLAHVKATRPA